LERIERGKLQNAGEDVEGPAGFLKEPGIGEVSGVEFGTVVFPDPVLEVMEESVVEEDTAVDGGCLGIGKEDPLAEAGRPATVAHAFPEIEAEDLPDGDLRIGEPVLQESGYSG